jgi:hypothetical protein
MLGHVIADTHASSGVMIGAQAVRQQLTWRVLAGLCR